MLDFATHIKLMLLLNINVLQHVLNGIHVKLLVLLIRVMLVLCVLVRRGVLVSWSSLHAP